MLLLLLRQHCGLIKFFISIINIRQNRIITIILLSIKTTQYSNIFKNYLYHHCNDTSLIFLITNFLNFFLYVSLIYISVLMTVLTTINIIVLSFDLINNLEITNYWFNFVNIFYKYCLQKKAYIILFICLNKYFYR